MFDRHKCCNLLKRSGAKCVDPKTMMNSLSHQCNLVADGSYLPIENT